MGFSQSGSLAPCNMRSVGQSLHRVSFPPTEGVLSGKAVSKGETAECQQRIPRQGWCLPFHQGAFTKPFYAPPVFTLASCIWLKILTQSLLGHWSLEVISLRGKSLQGSNGLVWMICLDLPTIYHRMKGMSLHTHILLDLPVCQSCVRANLNELPPSPLEGWPSISGGGAACSVN